ncbi:aminoglycoside phosphotransferase family protein [Nonomuraea typhae]|uniref:Aminoglycoside phosphotransferase family protein n=1 Tax=Nonomuraea typhae TaxID=2603600 RepID=A0ABW7YL67_9ACTN
MIVKLYAGPAQRRAVREGVALTALTEYASVPFHVPELVAFGPLPLSDVLAVVLGDLGDLTLRRAMETGSPSRGAALGTLGRLLAAFHRVPYPHRPSARPRLSGQVSALQRQLPESLRKATRTVLDQVILTGDDLPPVWCHGDLHLDNVLLTPNGETQDVSLIDFEQITFAPAEYDLAQTIVTADALDPAQRDLVLAGYGSAASADVLTGLITFQVLRGWHWAAVHEKRDIDLWRSRLHRVLTPKGMP